MGRISEARRKATPIQLEKLELEYDRWKLHVAIPHKGPCETCGLCHMRVEVALREIEAEDA